MKLNDGKTLILSLVVTMSATVAFGQPEPKSTRNQESGSQTQPQGETGPINTKSGGAPPSSPQGETPAGMQSAPQGSSTTIRTDNSGTPEGTPKK